MDVNQMVDRLKNDLNKIARRKTPQAERNNLKSGVKTLVESLPEQNRYEVLKKAAGTSIRRFEAAASTLAKCQQSDGIDQWFMDALTHEKKSFRSWMCQVLEDTPLARFDQQICTMIREDADLCWRAVSAAGSLGTPRCLDTLLWFVGQQGEPLSIRLVQALGNFDSRKSNAILKAVMNDPKSYDRERVFAAIGLAKNGKKYALKFLVKMLKYDASHGIYAPLSSCWAAKGLSDIYGWDLDWDTRTITQEALANWRNLNI